MLVKTIKKCILLNQIQSLQRLQENNTQIMIQKKMTFESPYSKLTFFSTAPELLGDTDF